MMLLNDVRMALQSIKSAKWRSFMTMLGVILGVLSVVSIVSIGEGVKREIVGQIDHLGADLITVKPGRSASTTAQGQVTDINLLQTFTNNALLSESDLKTTETTTGVGAITPISGLNAIPSIEKTDYPGYVVMGVNEQLPQLLKQRVAFGGFFQKEDADANAAVIGSDVAHEAFKENAPIGRSLQVRGETFIVRGVFDKFANSPLAINTDYNRTVFIPYGVAKRLNGDQPQIQQVLVRPADKNQAPALADEIRHRLAVGHGNQDDFTVLSQKDTLFIANRVVNVLTGLISAVAAISLIVGGVGIMNIMLVSVSERTGEIGIRKAVGATNGQILGQFAIEASMISVVGGLVGVLGSLVVNYFIRVFTDLKPVMTWQVLLLSLGVALVVGVFFGATPAVKAARKDPIEALRSN